MRFAKSFVCKIERHMGGSSVTFGCGAGAQSSKTSAKTSEWIISRCRASSALRSRMARSLGFCLSWAPPFGRPEVHCVACILQVAMGLLRMCGPAWTPLSGPL